MEHGGHIKFARGTRTDKHFRRFLHDYAATVKGTYQTPADLPTPTEHVVVATAQHLRLTDIPKEFSGMLTRIDLHRWTDTGWSRTPSASVDGASNPKNGQFQGIVFAKVPRASELAKEIQTRRQFPGGRYLARVYIDRDGNAAKNRDYEMGAGDFVGEAEFDGPWPAGYQPPKILKAPIEAAASQ